SQGRSTEGGSCGNEEPRSSRRTDRARSQDLTRSADRLRRPKRLSLMTMVALDQLSILKLVAARLEAAGIQYMVTGSMASGHYGHPRMTRDIDLVVMLVPPQAAHLGHWLGPEFICDADAARTAIAARRMFNVFHREAPQKIDFIVLEDRDYELEKFGRRR